MDAATTLRLALVAASSLIELIKNLSDDETVLEALVSEARSQGREVDAADVRASIREMDASGAALALKLKQ